MSTFKQYLKQSLNEQNSEELRMRLQQAVDAIDELSIGSDDWVINQRAKELKDQIDNIITDVGGDTPIPDPTFDVDMNQGGNLDMDLGFDLDLSGTKPPPSGVKWGFDNQRSDPRYSF